MQQKKIPLRKCVGCNEMKPKKELLRVVRPPEGEITLDFTGKKSGRGAYVCPKAECIQKAKKGNRLAKAFDCAVDPGVYDKLESELANEQK